MIAKEIKEDPSSEQWDQHISHDNKLFYTKQHDNKYYLKLDTTRIYEIDVILTYNELVRGFKMFTIQEIINWINRR